jgi:Ca-activated chloride channel family protein
MRDPGLLEFAGQGLFQASIYPIPAHGEQTVEIEYASVIDQVGTDLVYRYPLHESMGATIGSLVFDVNIAGQSPVRRVYSPHHNIDVDIQSSSRGMARVTAESMGASTAEDFELYITRSGEDVGFSLLTWDPDDGQPGYFMMSLSPGAELDELEVLPKQVTFVVDTSGSMAGIKMEQARQMLRQCIGQLGPDDTFNVVGFSTRVTPVFTEPRRADRNNVAEAMAFVDRLNATGNTNISGALSRAFEDPASSDRPHVILFVTDGLPTEGETNIQRIISASADGVVSGDRRVFTFGVGYDVNTQLLDGISRQGRGRSGYVRPEENMSDVVGEFYASIGDPLLTRMELDFGPAQVDRVYPNPLPDLYHGGQVTLFGRFDANASGFVTVRGQAGRESVSLRFPADYAPVDEADRSFIAHLWAARRVDDLLAQIETGGINNDNMTELMALATEWNIVTPYTSYLTTEPSEDLAARPVMPAALGGPDRDFRGNTGTGAARAMPRQQEVANVPAPGDVNAEGSAIRTRSGNSGIGWANSADDEVQRAPRPQAAMAPPAPAPVQGREAVEAAIARNELTDSTTLSSTRPDSSARTIGTRRFQRTGGLWVQDNLARSTADEVIEAFSDRYFQLMSEVPGISDVLALGSVRFEWNGRIYEIRN